jgi:hypothetical protein
MNLMDTWLRGRILKTGGCFLVFIACLSVIAPINVNFPAQSLDSSWMFAMNEAIARRLVIGKEIVLTMGPYASIYSKQYHPATYIMVLIAGVYIAICYSIVLLEISHNKIVLMYSLTLVIPYMFFVKDVIFTSYCLYFSIMALIVSRRHYVDWATCVILIVASGALGLIVAIKASFILPVFIAIALSASVMVFRRRSILALWIIASAFSVLCLGWLLAGQPLSGIASYLGSAVQLTVGYNEAMAYDGDSRDIVVFVIAALLVLFSIVWKPILWDIDWLYALALFASFLFLAFKAAFVRADHAEIGGMSALVAAIALRTLLTSPARVPSLCAAIIAFVTIDIGATGGLIISDFFVPFQATLGAIQARFEGEYLGTLYDETLAKIRAIAPLPKVSGTADIYHYSLSPLLASENTWNPRPVVQSYVSYTPELQHMDAEHLSGERAPDHLFLRVEAIDGRIPSLDGGPTWPEIFRLYEPRSMEGEFLLLDRRAVSPPPLATRLVFSGKVRLNESVSVPRPHGVIVAEIHMHRSTRSRLAAALFKPSIINADIRLVGGATRHYRFIPGEAELGFVLSPLIEWAKDFGFVTAASDKLRDSVVETFRLQQESAFNGVDATYDLALYDMEVPPADGAGLFDPIVGSLPGAPNEMVDSPCTGFIDTVNGQHPLDGGAIAVQGPIAVRGWVAADLPAGTSADEVYITLHQDASGQGSYVKAHEVDRMDVAASLHKPGLLRSGFSAEVVGGALHGQYRVGLAFRANGTTVHCSNIESAMTAE